MKAFLPFLSRCYLIQNLPLHTMRHLARTSPYQIVAKARYMVQRCRMPCLKKAGFLGAGLDGGNVV